MSPERWQQVKQLFDAASRLGPAERAAFLTGVCGGDAELRREVEALVASHEAAGGFMQSPAVGEVAAMFDGGEGGLKVGESVGHYEIVAPLGAGGMGEVYLAEDTGLKRKVAIKLLPPDSLADGTANRRLLREAKAAATLDHPHICSVYEVGEDAGRTFVVMQYVEGETLDARMRRQPLSLEEAVALAAQIADALAEAHAQGVVHRDIKPSNVLLNRRGRALVTDFGLAKLTRDGAPSGSGARTQSLLTTPGMVVGTVPYMSPEQVRGEEVDARTDLFSLGVLLYEVLSGRQPFAAESVADTMSAILTHEPPPLARYSREANAELERIVAKALRKDREERYQTARDLLLDLRSLADEMRFEARLERSVPPDVKGGPRDEVSSARTVIIETAARGPARTTAGAEPSTRDQKKASNIGGRSRASAVRTALVVVAALAVVAAAGWYYRRSSNARWAAGQVPRVEQLAQAGNYFAAYDLAVTVQKHLPNDPTVTRLMPTISDTLSVTTEPPGALVYLKRFSADESGQFPPRELVGATPVKDLRIARGQYVIQI